MDIGDQNGQDRHQYLSPISFSLGDHLIWDSHSSSTDHMSDTDSEESPYIKRKRDYISVLFI